MSNWFNKISGIEGERYRVVVPMDIWVDSTGNPQVDQETVYNLVKEILSTGIQLVDIRGFKEFLQLGDVKKYSNIF